MRHWIVLSLLAITLVGTVRGDYITGRKTALELTSAGQHEEALTRFVVLADASASPLQQSDAYHQAALCALQLKQVDRAAELAGKIPLVPQSKACRMLVLESDRQWQTLVDEYGPEEISSWPESLRGEAYLRRGMALFVLKRGAAAARDFEAAVDFLTDANSKGYCLNSLGDTYRHLLQDNALAMAAYGRTLEIGTVYKQCQAAINTSEILVSQGKSADALKTLDRVDLQELTAPYWRGRLLYTQGRVLLGSDQKTVAKTKFQEALRIKDLPDEVRQACESALRQL